MAKSKELVEALSALIAQQPFFACYLLDMMRVEENDSLPSAGTDGVRIVINPKWFGTMSIPERVFVLAHEVMHGIFQHMPRAKLYRDRGLGPDLKRFNDKKYNAAADYVINDLLSSASIGKPPPTGLFNPNFTKDMLVDDVYVQLPDDEEDNNFDEHMEPDPNSPPPTDGEVKRAIASATNAAKAQGKMPGDLERIVGDLVEPKQNWKELLKQAIDSALGRDESTWRRANRRKLTMAPGVVLPGVMGYRAGKVGVVIDTSGSIGQDELTLFMSETAGILQDGKPEECKVFWTDTRVAHIDDVETPAELESLKAHGGGGTDMEAAFPVISESFEYTDDITTVVLTDGYTSYTQAPDGMNVIWVTTGHTDIPYGKVIKMDMTHQ